METALWVIAIVEVIRAVQNFAQLAISAKASGRAEYKRATDAFIKSMDKSDKEFFGDLIARMEDEKNEI